MTTDNATAAAAETVADNNAPESVVNTYSEKAIKFDFDVKAVINGTYRDSDGDDIRATAADFANKDSEIVRILLDDFNALDKDEKRQARSFRDSFQRENLDAMAALTSNPANLADPSVMQEMQEIGRVLGAITSATGSVYVTRSVSGDGASAKKIVDPRADYVKAVGVISLAYATILNGCNYDQSEILAEVEALTSAPETLAESAAYAEWLIGGEQSPEPYASEIAKSAARVSLGRSTGGQGKPPKGSVRTVPGYVAPTKPGEFSTIDPEKAKAAEKDESSDTDTDNASE